MTSITTPNKTFQQTSGDVGLTQTPGHWPERPARPTRGLTFTSLLRADTTVVLRTKSTILNLVLPLIVLVITGFELRNSASATTNTISSVIGLAIVYGLVSSDVMGYPVNIARDRESGVFQRLRVTPAPRWAVMLSRLTVHLVINIVIALVVAVIGAIIHGLALGAGQYLLLVPAAIIGGAVFLSLGQMLAALLKSATAISAVGRIVFIALILLGVLGSTGVLGQAMQSFSQWTPLGTSNTLFTAALTLTAFHISTIGPLLASLGYTAVFAFFGIRFFRWDAR